MMPREWHEVRVRVPRERSEEVANFLIENGAPGLQSEEHGEAVFLIAHFSEAPPLDRLREFCATIGAALDPAAVRTRTIAEEDWAQNWKLHFRPQRIGSRLYVCPPWEAIPPSGTVPVVINPGMAFGTGQHASTRGCLNLLDWALATQKIRRAMDLGTGSGVLAIALAKLGVPEVWAVDTDAHALAIARENARRNDVEQQLHFTPVLDDVSGTFDLIVANLFANILATMAARLSRMTTSAGVVVCSGILAEEEQRVCAAYQGCGLELRNRYAEEGWVSLAFLRFPG